MGANDQYNGGLTAEKFLFYEIRIVAEQYLLGRSIEEIVDLITKDNLFQYPTERKNSRMTRACYKRIMALDNDNLVLAIVNAPMSVAKQINLYAMMRYNRLVWDFMVNLIGEKFRQQDYSYSKKDMNVFFMRLQEQNENIAKWSDSTITKLKQVLTNCLVETEILDSTKANVLNPIFISEELESGIRENNDFEALAAFNCFK